MKNKKIILTAILSILMIGAVSAVDITQLNPEKASQNTDTDTTVDATQNPLSFALSFAESEKTLYNPGERAEFSFSLSSQTAKESEVNLEINKCDSTTDFNDLTKNDCNENVVAENPRSINPLFAAGVNFDISTNVPEEDGRYEVVAYLWRYENTGDGIDNDDDGTFDEVDEALVSDAPNKFIIVSSDDGGGDGTTGNEDLDSDGDGVSDSNDLCENTDPEASVDSNGCAVDSDGDTVADFEDECPTTAGSGSDGCPVTKDNDRDGDGVVNTYDDCPDTPGTVNNSGCPKKSGGLPLFVIAFFLVIAGIGTIAVVRYG